MKLNTEIQSIITNGTIVWSHNKHLNTVAVNAIFNCLDAALKWRSQRREGLKQTTGVDTSCLELHFGGVDDLKDFMRIRKIQSV